MSERTIEALGFEAPGRPYVTDYVEGPPGDGQVRIETLYSGFSAGTELTFHKGTNPGSRWDDRLRLFRPGDGGPPYPVRFVGYMEVGRVVESRAAGYQVGDVVAGTWGHKSGHTANVEDELLVPVGDLDPVLGTLVGQMGPIAANGILHADVELLGPSVARLGDSLAGRPALVIGGGTVGMMTALFAQRAGASEVVVTDPSEFRRLRAESLGLKGMTETDAVEHAKRRWHHGGPDRGADVVFQTRAHSGSLHAALQALRPQGTVIDLAFYPGGAEDLRLGEEFHHNNLAIRCAQIGRMPRGTTDRWDRARLAAETLDLLRERSQSVRTQLVTHVVDVGEAPEFLRQLVAERPEFIQIVFRYPGADA